MKYSYKKLSIKDISSAVELDHKWFGDFGATKEQLTEFISSNPDGGISLYVDNNFEGFATFEILHNQPPTDYIGHVPSVSKVLFIQQFTTSTNYSKKDMQFDLGLIVQIEKLAKRIGCLEVWEALSTTHPYSSSINSQHDAFGFYETLGYSFDSRDILTWSPESNIAIPCYLFRKRLTV